MFPENFLVGTIFLDEICLSSVFILFDKKTAYYQYAGNLNNPKYPGANKLLLFEAFKELKKIDVNSVNLGGFREAITKTKKQDGIQSFKMRFGAEKTFGIHFIHVIKPLNYFIFNFALKIKSFLKRKDLSFINLSGLEIKKSK
jgi:lipid II:glycine glycyltransferase (peptidoglycan interpeptide bridge formation enzyme)